MWFHAKKLLRTLKFWKSLNSLCKSGSRPQKSPKKAQKTDHSIAIYSNFWIGMVYFGYHLVKAHVQTVQNMYGKGGTLLPAVHFLEQAFAGADFSTEKFSAALSLISAALFQCPKIAKFSVAHFFKLSCDLRCSFSIAKSRKILRCSSSDIWKGSKLSCREY